ncbi:MAG: glutathione synthase [Alphaproteobacteria bacterium]|nr:glutathione synthase [Alphaproteobacteria bacterium]
MRVAFQVDPLDSLKPSSDTSLLLIKEACARGFSVFYYTPSEMRLQDGQVYASGDWLSWDEGAPLPQKKRREDVLLSTMDVLWIRQNPPFDMAYLTPTYLLEMLPPQTLVLNDPRGLRDSPEKILPLLFPELTPPSVVTQSLEQAVLFFKEYVDVVLKPLYEYAGRGVVRFEKEAELRAWWQANEDTLKMPVLLQQFLPEVFEGDRRLFLIDGQFVGGFNKRPAPEEFRANLGLGGVAEPLVPSMKELDICERIGNELRRRGLFFVGIDVVGGYLLEINATSPTAVPAFNALYKRALEQEIWDAIVARKEGAQ